MKCEIAELIRRLSRIVAFPIQSVGSFYKLKYTFNIHRFGRSCIINMF